MLEEKKLYPLQICKLEDQYQWGTETFGLADLGYRDSLIANGWLGANTISEVMDTFLDRVVGDDVYEWFGRQFPVQIKTIKCTGKMPLRVHPDDLIASERYDALGKEKLWYVQSASADARLFIGFNRQMDASAVYNGCLDSSIEQSLNVVTPKAGQSYYIKPGTVHGASGTMTIIEVSQSSGLDFLLTAWGNELGSEEFDSELTVVDALDFIDYAPAKSSAYAIRLAGQEHRILDLDQFAVSKIALTDPLHIYTEEYKSYILYYCLYGSASVKVTIDGIPDLSYTIKEGETILIPAEVPDFIIAPTSQQTALLEVMTPAHEVSDPYINPAAEESVDDE